MQGAETMGNRHRDSLPSDYFVGMYASDPDPWRFTTSDYERDKYAATLASLPCQQYRAALEIGCSIGVFTRALAPRCEAVVALDVVPEALNSARGRCSDQPQVRFELGSVPADWPEGRFDLIVISEVLYFFDAADLKRLAERVEASLEPGGDCVLVHWLGETDYPHSGDEAAEGFIHSVGAYASIVHQARTEKYRLDVLRRAEKAGDGAGSDAPRG